MLAVNPPSNEGNLETMLPEDLLASVQSTEAEAQTGRDLSQRTTSWSTRAVKWAGGTFY